MRKWKISYTEEMTEEDIRAITGEETMPIEEVLDDYLWCNLHPEGDEWDVEEVQ